MGIRETELKKLYGRSGNVCAYPACRMALVSEGMGQPAVVLGEAAHIIGESSAGPRGESALTLEERNRADNLILLCSRHHQLVDARPAEFTVERLVQMKADHEAWVAKELGAEQLVGEPTRVTDVVHSSLLAITRLPRFIFSSPCVLTPPEILDLIRPFPVGQTSAFIQRDGRLFAFQDLRIAKHPFARAVNAKGTERHSVEAWLEDPDRARWVVDLLNRSLSRLMASRGLAWDKDHKRYYFPCPDPPANRTVRYRGLNQTAERSVVWQPTRKSTGEPRGHWYHLAVSGRFLRTGQNRMVLSLRPELRITKDGRNSIDSERIGARVTKKKSRVFNYDLLGDVNFWRDYIGQSRPHIKLEYGSPGQFLLLSTHLLNGSITWPGLPAEHAMPFKNIEYLDDLFSWAEVHGDDSYEDDDDDEPEFDEEEPAEVEEAHNPAVEGLT